VGRPALRAAPKPGSGDPDGTGCNRLISLKAGSEALRVEVRPAPCRVGVRSRVGRPLDRLRRFVFG